MPELPEVTYFKKYIDATALHQQIASVSVSDDKIAEASQKKFSDALSHQEFKQSHRHGKYVMLTLTNDKLLVFHFGMTGKFEYLKHDNIPNYAYFIIVFTNGSRLCFTCPRKLGKVYLAESLEAFIKEHKLGIDAMDLDLETFQKLLSGKRGTIKGALFDQHLIAGIGNMYADEMLFQSKIHPKTSIDKLTAEKIEGLYNNIHPVLKTVIKSQTEETPLPENYLTPHRRSGASCPNGNGSIKKIKVSGRSTYFCPSCQVEN